MKKFVIVMLCLVLGACVTAPDGAGQGAGGATAEQNKKIDDKLEACYEFFGIKSHEATKRAREAWGWTLIGLVSGSIIAPALTAANAAANAPWIAGFSGLSGASVAAVSNANAFGIGPASSLDGLLAVGQAVRADMALALDDTKDFKVRSEAANRASLSCSAPQLVPGYLKAQNEAAIKTQLEAQQTALEAKVRAQEDRIIELQEKQKALEARK